MVLDMLVRMRREEGLDKITKPAEIDSLIILDREVDLVTPMMTQVSSMASGGPPADSPLSNGSMLSRSGLRR